MSRRSTPSKKAVLALQNTKRKFVKLGSPKASTLLGDVSDPTKNRTIKVGDCVYVMPPGEKPGTSLEGFKYWKAQVREIRGDGEKEQFLVHWFYTEEHARLESNLSILPTEEDQEEILDRLGQNELLSSDHEQIISSQTIEDIVPIVSFDDKGPSNSENISPQDYFMRFRLVTKEGRPHFLGVTKHCTCQKVYDPDQTVQRFCPSCVRWFDQACMVKSKAGPMVPFEEGQEETPAEEVKRFLKSPITRGYSGGHHLYWGIVGTGRVLNQVATVIKGPFDGEFPDWKSTLPKGFLQEMEALQAMPGYICPWCEAVI
ncbi:hypothetical protein GLOTRDRAFT_134163 [Gloeophyllum trabeum ATCC 11539]|uniref:BAH domain-containing protein n=1 Tax=Gloeophyllum trabeum (strain ATCC 11539 / FP-39264 / Madison 617) TaxID=670483 RepID=S7RCS3_GLOTA|nr:uncharacterized protein GLOTRDRAFT_134163 [Gloeophyllum trabeum ATCC 11539]EPQ50204.1 hypothetical protein GLOTRDRAFT_134163 [Gloeophyllum trabeum ATCC 11539]